MRQHFTPQRLALAALLILLYVLPMVLGPLTIRTLTEISYFVLLVTAFNLLFSYAGLLSFGFNATFGLAAYTTALLLTKAPGLGLCFSAVLAILAATAAGAMIAALCVRLRGGYFSLLTMAFSQFLLAIALKWRTVTHGEDGIIVQAPMLTVPFVGEVRLADPTNLYWITVTVVIVCMWLMWRFMRTPLGQAVALVRENDERASFLGYDSYATKVAVFTLASAMAAVAGVLYVLLQKLAAPSLFGLPLAGDVLFMAVLGGSSSFLGPAVGAAAYHVLQDQLSQATEHWAFFIGALFVLLVIFAPGGLSGIANRVAKRTPR